jgi:hypothetical protein
MNPMSLWQKASKNGCQGFRSLLRWKSLMIFVAMAVLIAAALAPVHVLTISAVKKHTILLVRRIRANDCFSHRSIHSVELSPVQDYFRVSEDYGITLFETRFRSSNVGLPYAAFGEEVFMQQGDGYSITNMSRKIPELLIWANERYDNTLTMGTESWPLYAFAGNILLRIGVDRVSLMNFIFLWAFS